MAVVDVPGRFVVVRELGAGGMGKVYEAHDRELDARVALKVLHESDGEAIEQLKHEFRVAADVRHHNLVRLGELFEHAERWCFSMELVEGSDLMGYVTVRPRAAHRTDQPTAVLGKPDETTTDRRWDGETPSEPAFDVGKLKACFAQLADGLAALHAAGIVHRDVKPSNIRLRPDGRVVLLDLGLAAIATDLDDSGLMAGTVEYMAPEQTQSAIVTTAADVYALGAVLYHALVGRPPFVGPVPKVIAEKQTGEVIPPAMLFPEVPDDLDRLCMALLALDPAARPTAAEVAAGLRAETPAVAVAPAPRAARAFVGRDQELKTLLRAADRAREAPIVRVVIGPSGIGKTRLLSRVAQACREYGSFVCFGRCRVREHVRLNAWEPLLDGVTRHLSSLPRADAVALLPDDADAIARMFPVFARVLPVTSTSSVPAAELERRAIVALRELLTRIARTTRVVIIVDDVQWATPESLALFAKLVEPPGAPPLALVLGLRTTETATDAAADWLAGLSEHDIDLAMMALEPLSAADARSLAHLLVLDSARAERIAEETGGHPLLLEMMASMAGDELPRTMRQRVEALAPAHRDLLAVLAAAGAPVRIDLLASAAGRDWFPLVDDLRDLLDQRLVTATGLRRTDHVEPFHAQIAEAVLALADPAAVRATHARLAESMTQLERRALHWAWAGDAARAAADALALVAQARHALAYSRASDVCEAVLALELPAALRAQVQRAHADALTGSGHARRAALAYRDGALAADGPQRLDLERRAAENFLRCGALDEGMALFDRVAGAIGYRATRGPASTIAALLLERARLRLRGLTPRRGAIDATIAAKSDACYSLSTGLAMVDAISGALFQTRSTRFALDSGDPARVARALAIEACFVSAWGSKARPRATPIIDAATALADEIGDPLIRGFAETARGICVTQWGEFRRGVEHCDRALAIFRDHCAGVAWEERTSEVFSIWSLAWTGDWGEVARRCDALTRAGEATGERYAIMHAVIGSAVSGILSTDQPERARARVAEVMAGWSNDRFDLLRLRELVATLTIDCYELRGREALDRLRRHWKALTHGRMLDLEPVFVTLGDIRMRAAITAGDWAEVRTWSTRLDRVSFAQGLAGIGRAALAHHAGDRDLVLRELRAAEQAAERGGMELYALAARDRWGRLAGGDEGRAAVTSAAEGAKRRGIFNAERTFGALAPGTQ